MQVTRRCFILQTAGAAALGSSAWAAGSPLAESDPSAHALGYATNASRVDAAKFPRYRPGQRCGSCQFFQGKPSDASAQCSLFGAKLVNGAGWCNAYRARA